MHIHQGPLSQTAILQRAACCVVRKQEESVLVYNTRTDELHLIPPTGYYVISLCDGARTVAEIEMLLRGRMGSPANHLSDRLGTFLGQLLQRGILEIQNGETR